jgi:hypothetical protein
VRSRLATAELELGLVTHPLEALGPQAVWAAVAGHGERAQPGESLDAVRHEPLRPAAAHPGHEHQMVVGLELRAADVRKSQIPQCPHGHGTSRRLAPATRGTARARAGSTRGARRPGSSPARRARSRRARARRARPAAARRPPRRTGAAARARASPTARASCRPARRSPPVSSRGSPRTRASARRRSRGTAGRRRLGHGRAPRPR